jgi:ferredoxin-NADP reductase
MVRHRIAVGAPTPVRVVVSARTEADLVYRAELDAWRAAGVVVDVTLTRAAPWRRIDAALLAAAGPAEHVFVCGPTAFAEAAADHLLDLGHDAGRIRVERFGGA